MTEGHRLFAAVYDRILAPMERAGVGERRARLLSELRGAVLDVGAGTGANLEHYRRADRVVLAEPDPAMRARLLAKLDLASVPVQVSDAGAESLPFDDGGFDAVVFTLVLCTVEDPARALAEARRVLVPGGRLVVLEHVRARPDEARLGRWQDRLAPVWARLAAGCQLNRDTASAIERAGFVASEVENFRLSARWLPTSSMLATVAIAER